jgi:predicted N-acetyltransferase YhbS
MANAFAVLDGRLHDRASFACGNPVLDDYLRHRAGQHQRDGIATTHVLFDEDSPRTIIGYCTLSAAQIHLDELREDDRRKLPAHPVPALRMARLAVTASEHGKGHGALLVGHAVNLALAVRRTMGVRVLLVDAKDERAATFYMGFGFRPSSHARLTMYLPVSTR